jgi:hypothetical protein
MPPVGYEPRGARRLMRHRSRWEPDSWFPAANLIYRLHCKLVVWDGVEPAAFEFSGASGASLRVARRGPIGDLPGQIMAGCRLAWPGFSGRWLPVWLPTGLPAGKGEPSRSFPESVAGVVPGFGRCEVPSVGGGSGSRFIAYRRWLEGKERLNRSPRDTSRDAA